MSLFEAVFGEAIDRSAQQKRLNKIALPLRKKEKRLGDEIFKLGSYHPKRDELGIERSNTQDQLERARKLKALVSTRAKRDERPDDEKLQRKVDNASDALHPWRSRRRKRDSRFDYS